MVNLSELLQVMRVYSALTGTAAESASHLGMFGDHISMKKPPHTIAVIALPTRRDIGEQNWSHLVAVSKFRAAYSVIDELASALATAALQTGIVPTIQPVNATSFDGMTWHTPFVRTLREKGAVIYWREKR